MGTPRLRIASISKRTKSAGSVSRIDAHCGPIIAMHTSQRSRASRSPRSAFPTRRGSSLIGGLGLAPFFAPHGLECTELEWWAESPVGARDYPLRACPALEHLPRTCRSAGQKPYLLSSVKC
jgi:hypothetical protein